jgi:PAS domain S-box-containing protein
MEQQIQVLHVDDDRDFVDMTSAFLEREDERIGVISATSADEGLEMLADLDIDCIVSDYDMPGRNGIEFLETVREEYPDLPFILYTGKGSEEIASDAITAGVTDYLQKDVGSDQYTVLANRITNAVDSYRVQRTLSERNRELSRYKLLVDSMLESACIYDEDGRFEVVNEYLADWYGKPRDELEGTRSNLLRHIEEQHSGDPFQALLDGEREEISGRVEAEFPGHGHAVLDYRLSPLRVEGSVEGVVGVTRDVTDRKEQTRRLETLIRNLPGIVYRCRNEPDWPMEFVRGEAEALTGYSAEALETQEVIWGEEILHPADRDRTWETVQEAIDEGRPFEVTYRIRTADGTTKWMWERGRVVRSLPSGDEVLEGFIADITDRKKHEEELERTNALLSTLFDTLPQGVLAENESRDVLAANQGLFDLFEMPGSPEEVVGADCVRMAEEVSEMFTEPEWFVERIEDLTDRRDPIDGEELALADGRTFERSYRPIDLPGGPGHLWVYDDITERKAHQRALESVLDQMGDVVFVHPEEGPLMFTNQAAVDRYGFEESELLTMSPADLNAADESEEVSGRAQRVMQEGQHVFETEHRTASGETIPVEINATAITFRGEPAILSIVRDVTERKEAERELRETKERLDLAVNGAGLGVWDWDVRTDEVEFNEQWAEMLGYPPDEIEPHIDAWEKRVHPEDKPAVETALENHIEGETPYYDTEHRMRTADGDWKWIRDIGRVVERTDDGRPARAVGIHVDVTELKERERALEQLQERTQRLMQTATKEETAQLAVDTAHEVLDAELSGCHLLENDGHTLEPAAFLDTVRDTLEEPPAYDRNDDGDPASRAVWQAFERGEPLVIEDTREYGRLAEVTPARSGIIHPLGDYGVFITSATEPNAFDETQTVLIEIIAMTLEAAFDRVEREQKLRRQNDRLDQFASVVSHDLRNPLNVATGRLTLAREEPKPEHFDGIESALDRMERIIEDLLVLSREGQDIGSTEPVDLRAAAGAAWAMAGDDVDGAEMVPATDGKPSTIEADGDRLRQLLENLFRNAVEHGSTSPDSDSREDSAVTVTVGLLDDGFYVEDDGPGIPEDQREEVFTAGYSTSDEGIGFGLSIVEQVVEAHDWDIRVTEGDDGGARFEVTGVEFTGE